MAVSVNEGGNTLDNFDTLLTGDMIRFYDSHEWMLKSYYVELKWKKLLVRRFEFDNNPSPFYSRMEDYQVGCIGNSSLPRDFEGITTNT